jgi:hypothetical protein
VANKYVPKDSPYWVDGLEARLRQVLSEYNKNIQKFETEHSKRAGTRARNNLLEVWHICKARRKEILAKQKEIGSMYEHPSWHGIEEGD